MAKYLEGIAKTQTVAGIGQWWWSGIVVTCIREWIKRELFGCKPCSQYLHHDGLAIDIYQRPQSWCQNDGRSPSAAHVLRVYAIQFAHGQKSRQALTSNKASALRASLRLAKGGQEDTLTSR
jgi:hypothetical protein